MLTRNLFGYRVEITRGPFATEVRFRKAGHYGVFVFPKSGYHNSKLVVQARTKAGK